MITPDFKVNCSGGANFYGHYFKCWQQGRPWHDRPAARDRAVVRRLFLHGCQHAGRRQDQQVGDAARPGREERHRSAQRSRGAGPVHRVEAARTKEQKWYAGETISVGIGQGAVAVTPVSMAVYMATLANGGTRVTPHLLKAVDDGTGWKPVPAPKPQSQVALDPEKLQAIRDGMWLVVNGARHGTTGTARRLRRIGQDRQRAGDLERRPAPRRGRARTCATMAGSSSSRRATSRKSPAWSSSSTASTAATPRAWRATSSTPSSRRSRDGRCRPRRRRRICRLRLLGSVRPGTHARRGAGSRRTR